MRGWVCVCMCGIHLRERQEKNALARRVPLCRASFPFASELMQMNGNANRNFLTHTFPNMRRTSTRFVKHFGIRKLNIAFHLETRTFANRGIDTMVWSPMCLRACACFRHNTFMRLLITPAPIYIINNEFATPRICEQQKTALSRSDSDPAPPHNHIFAAACKCKMYVARWMMCEPRVWSGYILYLDWH